MEIERRVERLERQNRLMKVTLIGVILVGIASWPLSGLFTPTRAVAQGGASPRIVEAEQFRLVSRDNKFRGAFQLDPIGGEPQLVLLGDDAKPEVGLSVTKDGPMLHLLNERQKRSINMVVAKDGPFVSLHNGGDHPQTMLSACAGAPRLDFWYGKGEPIAGFGLIDAGPFLGLSSENGGSVMLNVNKTGPSLCFNDEKRKTRGSLALALTKDGPLLLLLDKSGAPRAGFSLTHDAPRLMLGLAGVEQSVGLTVDATGPRLSLGDKSGQRVNLALERELGPNLCFHDEGGRPRALMVLGKDGPIMRFNDETGKNTWSAP